MKRNNKLKIFLLFIAVVGAGSMVVFFYFFEFFGKKESSKNMPLQQSQSVFNVADKIQSNTADKKTKIEQKLEEDEEKEKLKEYVNAIRRFSLKYPKELSAKEYNEGNDSYSIVFQDEKSEKSFQIFFTHYFSDVITDKRILKDVPSGKFTNPVEVIIGDGIRALAFISEGELGQMREIWFIKDDYLYEVTTYAELDQWLAKIMKTLNFQ